MKFSNFALLALSLISVDLSLAARCGKYGGNKSCPEGYCCSKFGFCGKTSSYCGSGCQSEFGICNDDVTSVVTHKKTTTTVTTTRRINAITKPITKKESTISVPIKTIRKSVTLKPIKTPTTDTVIKPTISTDETCGPLHGNTSCPAGECCSEYGYCGKTKEYCGTGCQSEFGKCDSTISFTEVEDDDEIVKNLINKKPKNFICVDCIGCIDCDVQPKMALYCPKTCKTKKGPIYCIQCVGCVDCSKNPEMAINCPNTCKKLEAI